VREVVIRPEPGSPHGAARIVGPGRRERGYLERISALAGELALEGERREGLRRVLEQRAAELDTSLRVERGCQRRIDRLEERIDRERERLAQAERQHKRLALALGALQRENELLRERIGLAEAVPQGRLEAPRPGRRRSRLAALFAPGSRSRRA
jgi:chromosome segregation ATPase